MTQDRLDALVANIQRWEDEIGWMYLDNAKPPHGPNVTVGLGMALFTVKQAQALRLPSGLSAFVNIATGQPADPIEIQADFLRVQTMGGGHNANWYRATRGLSVQLAPGAAVALSESELVSRYLLGIMKLLPGLEALPVPAQDGLVDVAWNVGSLNGFPSLIRACATGNFYKIDGNGALVPGCAAAECHVSTSRDDRNAWRAEQFQAAQGMAA